jgi:hypothetical protein
MKINSVFLVFFLVIIVFPATLFFIYKQPFVGTLTNGGNQTNQLENDPLVQRIKNEVILPFCQTNGQLTEEDLSIYFTQGFIDFWNDRINTRTDENYTALEGAQEKYKFMFLEYMEFKNCNDYLDNLVNVYIEKYQPKIESDVGYADYVYAFRPAKNVRISLYLKLENNALKIESVRRSASVNIGPFD